MMAAATNDPNRTISAIGAATRRFIDSQEAIRELADFALQEARTLDSEEASAAHLATLVMGSGVDPRVSERVYQIAQTNVHAQRSAVAEGHKKERQALREGAAAEDGRKVFRDYAEETIAGLIQGMRVSLANLGIHDLRTQFRINQFVLVQIRRPRVPILMQSLLTTAVSEFESFISATAHQSYNYRPHALRDSGSQYSWADVSEFETIDEFTHYAIDSQVDSLMRQGLDDWLKFFAKVTRAPLEELTPIAEPIQEVLQRRHVITHNGGRVSRQYLANTKGDKQPKKLGKLLQVDLEYLESALNNFTVLSLFISQAAASAVAKSTKSEDLGADADLALGEIVLDMLKLGRFGCVARLMPALEKYLNSAGSVETLRVNSWIARSRVEGAESIRAEVEQWDDSSLNETFQLAKSVLLERYDGASRQARHLVKTDQLTSYAMETWPLFEPLREYQSRQTASLAKKTTPAKTAARAPSPPRS